MKAPPNFNTGTMKFNKWLTVSTIGLLLMSIVANLITGYMADATKQSADAAKAAAKVAEQTLRISNKAFLGFADWQILNLEAGKVPEVHYRIINHGRIPATVIERYTGSPVRDKLPAKPQYSGVRRGNGAKIYPGRGVEQVTILSDYSAVDHRAIQSDQAVLWFYVKYVYWDGFARDESCALMKYELRSNKVVLDTTTPGYQCGGYVDSQPESENTSESR